MEIKITITETDQELSPEAPGVSLLWDILVSDEKELDSFKERIARTIQEFMAEKGINPEFEFVEFGIYSGLSGLDNLIQKRESTQEYAPVDPD